MLKKTVKQIVDEMGVLEKNLMGMLSLSDLVGVDEDMLKMFKSYANLVDLSKEYMMEQAVMIDNMNDKLDSIDQKLFEMMNKD